MLATASLATADHAMAGLPSNVAVQVTGNVCGSLLLEDPPNRWHESKNSSVAARRWERVGRESNPLRGVLGALPEWHASVPSAQFFEVVRVHTVIGFIADPVHGGNRDYTGWKLRGYPGPRAPPRRLHARTNGR
jgi:hypothetical protein